MNGYDLTDQTALKRIEMMRYAEQQRLAYEVSKDQPRTSLWQRMRRLAGVGASHDEVRDARSDAPARRRYTNPV